MHPIVRSAAALLLAFGLASPLSAQTKWPEKPVKLVVGFTAGSATDVTARLFAQKFSEAWGQPVVVENIAGNSGAIGVDRVAKAAPDGYTLMWSGNAAITILPSLQTLPFDPVRDFAPISTSLSMPSVFVVNNDLPIKSMADLIAYAKANPGKLNYASSGNGSLQHVTGAMLEQQGAIKMVHVPYKGTGPALQDLLGGQVDLTFGTAPPFMPHIASGKLRVLAVTGKQRLPSLPDVPTTAEAGYPKVDATSWFAVFAPAAVPKAVVDKLTADIRTVVQNPAFQQKAQEQGATADYQTPAQLGDKVKADLANWAQVVKTSKIEAE